MTSLSTSPTHKRARITLKKGREQSIQRFHHWIFSGAIAQIQPQQLQLGELVDVLDYKGTLLGTGTWEAGAISVRMLHFGGSLNSVEQLLQQRIEKALQLRKELQLIREQPHPLPNNIFRLVFGEADFLSGLIIDVYGHTAVIQAHSAGMYRYIHHIKEVLLHLPGYVIEAVYDKSAATLPNDVSSDFGDGYLVGKHIDEPLYENGLRFLTDFEHGQKTGFFIDQRMHRSLIETFAKNRKVLNMFCYTGGFSVYAMRGGAKQVVSLDSSSRALDIVNKTMALNFGEDAQQRHTVVDADAFEYLDALKGNEFDLIILDPPAFAKRRANVRNACNGYRKLNAQALRKIAPGGFLFTFSCSQLVSPYDFRMAVLTASVEVGRPVRIVRQLSQNDDHPIALFHPESEYLKGLLLYVE